MAFKNDFYINILKGVQDQKLTSFIRNNLLLSSQNYHIKKNWLTILKIRCQNRYYSEGSIHKQECQINC